jgi:diguanylate cyclase (GGDEF)-like protein
MVVNDCHFHLFICHKFKWNLSNFVRYNHCHNILHIIAGTKMKKRKMTLQSIIFGLIAFAMLGTYLGVMISSIVVSKENREKGYLSENQVYAEKLADTTDLLFQNMMQTLDVSASTIYTNTQDRDHLYVELNQVLKATNFFNSVFLVDKNGNIVRSAPHFDLEGIRIDTIGVNEAISKKVPLISQPYISKVTNKLIILVSTPVFDHKGNYFGFLGGTIYLNEDNSIKDVLGLHPKHDVDSYVYVVDSKGNIIYHPEKNRIGNNVFENGAVKRVVDGNDGNIEITNTKGVRMLAGYAYVETSEWGVISQTPKNSFAQPAFDLVKNVGKVTFPFVILVLIISIYLLKKFVRPLRELAQYAHQVAEKTSITRPDIPEGYFEVDELKNTMFLMVDHYRKQIQMFENEATLDPLTGLLNRRTLQKRIHEFKEYSVILLDIDHFKMVNDTYGHLMGDEVLKCLSDLIRKQTREYDISFRYGGEEFLILLPHTTLEEAYQIAERIRQTTEEIISPIGKAVTISVGVGNMPNTATHHTELLNLVDQALYRAKGNGRNRTVKAEEVK